MPIVRRNVVALAGGAGVVVAATAAATTPDPIFDRARNCLGVHCHEV